MVRTCPIRWVALWPHCMQLHMLCAHKGMCGHEAQACRYCDSASLLAADLWHAHTKRVSNLSTPVSYVNQHTQTNSRHCSLTHRQQRMPLYPRGLHFPGSLVLGFWVSLANRRLWWKIRGREEGRSPGIYSSLPWIVFVAAAASLLGVQFLLENPPLCGPSFLHDPSTCCTAWPLDSGKTTSFCFLSTVGVAGLPVVTHIWVPHGSPVSLLITWDINSLYEDRVASVVLDGP